MAVFESIVIVFLFRNSTFMNNHPAYMYFCELIVLLLLVDGILGSLLTTSTRMLAVTLPITRGRHCTMGQTISRKAGIMLAQRRRRWANIAPTLSQRLVFAERK